MTTRHDYTRQAATYDRTRGASPSVLGPLERALDGAPGSTLLDAGGGTGNYAAALRGRGWQPTVLDLSPEMLAFAAAKGLPVVEASADALPFADASFDAVMLVSMIHHVPRWAQALREAARVLRPGGRLAVMCWTREHADEVSWVVDYFPSSRSWMGAIHEPLAELLEPLPRATHEPVFFEDLDDLSVSALQQHPQLLLDPAVRAQTSYFERLEQLAPEELRDGTERLRADLAAGLDPAQRVAAARTRLGDAVMIAWQRPHATL